MSVTAASRPAPRRAPADRATRSTSIRTTTTSAARPGAEHRRASRPPVVAIEAVAGPLRAGAVALEAGDVLELAPGRFLPVVPLVARHGRAEAPQPVQGDDRPARREPCGQQAERAPEAPRRQVVEDVGADDEVEGALRQLPRDRPALDAHVGVRGEAPRGALDRDL